MHENYNDLNKMKFRLRLSKKIISIWPFKRGKQKIKNFLLHNFNDWPDIATFSFKYGVFVDSPFGSWPQGYRELFLFNEIEPNEVNIWSKILRKGFNVVDGGANLGFFSLLASKKVGSNGNVFAFEPVPFTCEALKKNIIVSKAKNIQIFQLALSNKSGISKINLVLDDPIKGNSSLGELKGYINCEKIECKLVTLDEIFTNIQIQLIKLDVEGGELNALKGAVHILKRNENPVITFEWNRITSSAFGYEPEDILFFLKKFDYDFYTADVQGLVQFIPPEQNSQIIPMVWALSELHRKKYKI